MNTIFVVASSAKQRKTLKTACPEGCKVLTHDGKSLSIFKQILKQPINLILLSADLKPFSTFDLISLINQKHIPVLILASKSKLLTKDTITSFLDYSVLDVVETPEDEKTLKDLRNKLNNFLKQKIATTLPKLQRPLKKTIPLTSEKIVLIGSSSGGPKIITELLRALPKHFPTPIIIVQHMPSSFTNVFADRLNKCCALPISEAKEGELIKKGKVLIAQGGHNITLEQKNKEVRVKHIKKKTVVMPSIDLLFTAAAKIYKERCIGIILTGMGEDGAQGAATIKQVKGTVIVQNEATSPIFGMPKAAIENKSADYILSPPKIIETLYQLL